MKNKKGIALENVTKLILAVIILALLFYGTALVYNSLTQDEDLENIQKIINNIEGKANALEIGEQTRLTIQGFDPRENWYILGFNKTALDSPDKCAFESCICICTGTSAENCDAKGICRDMKEDYVTIGNRGEVTEQVQSDKGPIATFVTKNVDYIEIPQNLIEIQLEKFAKSGKTTLLIKNA